MKPNICFEIWKGHSCVKMHTFDASLKITETEVLRLPLSLDKDLRKQRIQEWIYAKKVMHND